MAAANAQLSGWMLLAGAIYRGSVALNLNISVTLAEQYVQVRCLRVSFSLRALRARG